MSRRGANVDKINFENTEGKSARTSGGKGWKIAFVILLIVFVFIYYQVYIMYRYTTGKEVSKNNMVLYTWIRDRFNMVEKTTEEKRTLSIGVIGDMTVGSSLASGYKSKNYDFSSIFENVKSDIEKYDITIASLDTPVTGNVATKQKKYTVYDSPQTLLSNAKNIGIDLLVSATRSIADKGALGINTTIDNIEKENLKYVGIRKDNADDTTYIINKNGIKIGIISYVDALDTNLKSNEKHMVNLFDEAKIKDDIEKLRKSKVDYIIGFLNNKNTGNTRTDSDKKEKSQLLLDNGANVVICSDNVIQSSYEDVLEIEGKQSHVYVKYSLGEFVGEQSEEYSDVSEIVGITINKKIIKDKKGNVKDEKINMKIQKDATFVTLSNTAKNSYRLVNLEKVLKEYESNNNAKNVTAAEIKYLKEVDSWIKDKNV